jgi:hypothetical protein
LQVSFLLEANAKNLHQTGRAFIMREVLLYFSDFATNQELGARRTQQLANASLAFPINLMWAYHHYS